ncbi:activating transcription factor 7-interacting protein 2 [Scyliorhinus canicula]|uniref:activating transcription factor 7-interacting protein 2 n=1 Tax=Scyliorhinus canicula TaxID=7830 RepID=UPI0018F502CD|nr:activating transcription factor 7-interacting protein 2 [Scyliorhinus canicula]
MDVTNIAPRKIFRAKKTLRASDRKQWEALHRRRSHSGNGEAFKESDNQENHLQDMDAECIDGSKPDKHYILSHVKSELPKSELSQSSIYCKNDVKAELKALSDTCVAEKPVENTSLKNQEDIQSNGHLVCYQQREHQNIGLLRKALNAPSKAADQNVIATNGSAIRISSYVLTEDFSKTSKTYSTKIPELLNRKNYVKSISLDKKWDIEPVLRIIDVEDLKFVSSDPNDKTSNLKKIKYSIGPIFKKMSNEAPENMCNVQLSAPRVAININNKVEENVQNGSQDSCVSKCLNVEEQSEIDASKFLTDCQEGIECSPIILKEVKSSVLRKRTHSRDEERSNNKRVKTLEGDKREHFNLSSKNQSTDTTKKMSLDEIQKMLHQKMVTELSDGLDNKLEELTKRIENIDCRQKHEKLAKSILTRIKRLERKVKAALQTVDAVSLKKKAEESPSALFSQHSEMQPVPQYAATAVILTNASEPGSLAKRMDSSAALVVVSDQSSQPLPYRKTPDSSNYELNLQIPERTSNSMPEDAKIEWNIPLPKDLDIVIPASTNYCDISTSAPRNEESPDYLTLEPDSKRKIADVKQGSKLPSSQMVIDLTEDDERCINNQSRKKESEIQTSVMTTDTRPSATQSDNGIDDDSLQMPLVSEAQPAKPQINVANIKPSQTLCVQILSIGGPTRGNNVMTENLKPAHPMMDQQSQHPQVSIKSVHPAPLSKIQTTSDLPPEADNTSPPQKPELNLAQVRKPKGIALSWNITDVKQICAPVHSYQLYAYHEDPNLNCPSQWKIIGEIKALPLPMACTLTQFELGSKYYLQLEQRTFMAFWPFL